MSELGNSYLQATNSRDWKLIQSTHQPKLIEDLCRGHLELRKRQRASPHSGTVSPYIDTDVSDDKGELSEYPSKRTKVSPMLSDEDKLLLQMKDEWELRWADIQAKWKRQCGENCSVTALQMRLTRSRRKLVQPSEISYLRR